MDLIVFILQLIPQAILLNLMLFGGLVLHINNFHLNQFLSNFYN